MLDYVEKKDFSKDGIKNTYYRFKNDFGAVVISGENGDYDMVVVKFRPNTSGFLAHVFKIIEVERIPQHTLLQLRETSVREKLLLISYMSNNEKETDLDINALINAREVPCDKNMNEVKPDVIQNHMEFDGIMAEKIGDVIKMKDMPVSIFKSMFSKN